MAAPTPNLSQFPGADAAVALQLEGTYLPMMYDLTLPVMVPVAGAVVLAVVYVTSKDPPAAAVGPGSCSSSCSAAKPFPGDAVYSVTADGPSAGVGPRRGIAKPR